MGMYTEIYVNVDFKEETPEEVIEIVRNVCDGEYYWIKENGLPERWSRLFLSGSYYTPNTSVSKLTFDEISKQYSLIGKGDIKNYCDEIEQFFDLIKPWCENEFIGYWMYEEDDSPTLVFKGA